MNNQIKKEKKIFFFVPELETEPWMVEVHTDAAVAAVVVAVAAASSAALAAI